jgi:transcriptional regulator with XRE-family HTH domain
MAARTSPTVRRRRLGIELRRLREAVGLSLEDAARRLERTGATVSRMETGRISVRIRDVNALLDLYGVTDPQTREGLLTLVRESWQKGWWHTYSDVLPATLDMLVGLETAAASILTYEINLVPGLLQTADYARALFRAGKRFDSPDKIERQVELRLNRQAVLTGEDPPDLWAVLDEAAIRRQVGGPEVMRRQVERLVEASAQPNITIQVMPFAAGAHMGMSAAFNIYQFPEESGDPSVGYSNNQTGTLYIEKAEEVRRYKLIFDHLRAAALSPDDSIALLSRATKEH